MAEKIQFEATIKDSKLHNSQLDDNRWVDITLRVAGTAGVEAAQLLHRAKDRIATISFQITDPKKDE